MLASSFCRPKMIKALGLSVSGLGVILSIVGTAYANEAAPFRISVDGQAIDGSGAVNDQQRATDVGLSAVDLQVKFDGLDVDPVLNVWIADSEGTATTFATHINYPIFVERTEIRVMRMTPAGTELLATLPVSPNGRASWQQDTDEGELFYTLRAHDAQGRFDETEPRPFVRTTPRRVDPFVDHTAIRNISVSGGGVTVHGSGVAPDQRIAALGETVPVDADGTFVLQRILPAGHHLVDVSVLGQSEEGLEFFREIEIPQDEVFFVALADLTVGMRTGDAGIEAVRPGEYDEVYSRGRLAFYLKGKVRGDYLITAAADLGERELADLFGDLGGRNPRDFLRTLSPHDYYPVYGDDSTLVEDAPTRGKIYVRIERDASHVLWGNFHTEITGTQFLSSNRYLYGASMELNSDETTSFGERTTQLVAYGALPDSVQAQDEFLATGGTAYFLRRQAIEPGSQTVTVETRNPTTGRVVHSRVLTEGRDYRINPLQGTLVLARPVHWFVTPQGPVRDDVLGDQAVYVVVDYAYESRAGDFDAHAYGGRLQHWFGDAVRVGLTGATEQSGGQDRSAYGADVTLRLSETSFLRAEVARSHGQGIALWRSADGGLSWGRAGSVGTVDDDATAWEVSGRLDLADLGLEGTLDAHAGHREAGFASGSVQARNDEWRWGLAADIGLSETTRLTFGYDLHSEDGGDRRESGELAIAFQPDPFWDAEAGLNYTSLMSPSAIAAGKAGQDGSRVDAGLRVGHAVNDDVDVYAFGQGTLTRTGDIHRNDRVGIGGEFRMSETLALSIEGSVGTHGPGLVAGIVHEPSADERSYLGYRLDPARAFNVGQSFDLIGSDGGTLVAGLQRRLSDYATSYAESNYDLFGNRRSLAHSYGVLLTPDRFWTIDAGLVAGHVRDTTIDPDTGAQRPDFDRYAPSLSVGYVDEERGVSGYLRSELRFEDSSDASRSQSSYLLAGGTNWQVSDDWRFLASAEGIFTDSGGHQTSIPDTSFVETSIGYAYRPADNDRLNALVRYSWVYDMPGDSQLVSGITGDTLAPAQSSHIFSADINYRLNQWLTVGGKYGFRIGSIRNRAAGGGFDDWHRSSAHLGVLRADIHFVHDWDVMLEGRVLHSPEARTTDFGAITAIYKHLGDNFKLGVGYNFGVFSDDLRDLRMNDRGVFVNLVGSF